MADIQTPLLQSMVTKRLARWSALSLVLFSRRLMQEGEQ
jgi:hypothetical protein